MNSKLIIIDGKTYKSVEEMPEDVRRNYESAMSQIADNDRNGMPDVLENLVNFTNQDKDGLPDRFNGMTSNIITSSTKIIADGKEYSSLDELPPDVRANYQQAMGALDSNRNGVPDFFEGMLNTSQSKNEHNIPAVFTPSIVSASKTTSPNSNIEPEGTNKWMLALIGIVLFVVCVTGAFAAWYFFLR